MAKQDKTLMWLVLGGAALYWLTGRQKARELDAKADAARRLQSEGAQRLRDMVGKP